MCELVITAYECHVWWRRWWWPSLYLCCVIHLAHTYHQQHSYHITWIQCLFNQSSFLEYIRLGQIVWEESFGIFGADFLQVVWRECKALTLTRENDPFTSFLDLPANSSGMLFLPSKVDCWIKRCVYCVFGVFGVCLVCNLVSAALRGE